METRLATPEDFALVPERAKTMWGLVLLVKGKPAAIATTFLKNGPRMVFVDFLDRENIRPLTLHRFGKAAVRALHELGAKRFFAIADCAIPRSEAWLERLGFRLIGRADEGGVFVHE